MVLKNIFNRFGMSNMYGPQFRSTEMKEFCDEFGISQRHTIPYSPSSNGQVERENQSLLKRIKIATIGKLSWLKEVNKNSLHV